MDKKNVQNRKPKILFSFFRRRHPEMPMPSIFLLVKINKNKQPNTPYNVLIATHYNK